MKKLQILLIKPITITNQSLNSGIFPDKLKLAKITPIYKKKDDKYCITNYRPISVLPVISKIIDKTVFSQLYEYFTENNYLNKTQYGFRKFHSTEHAILEITERILSEFEMQL